MRREFDGLLSRLGVTGALMPMPAIDTLRGEGAIILTADLPGVPNEAIDVWVTGDVLRIAGEVDERSGRTEGDVMHAECRYGALARTIPLGFEPAEDAIDTSLTDGVLTITVAAPRTSTPQSRKA